MSLPERIWFVMCIVMLLILPLICANKCHAQTVADLNAQFPEAPAPQYNNGRYISPRVSDPLVNKKFVVSHGIYLAAAIFDAEVTRRGLKAGKCQEKNFGSNGPEIYGKNLAFWGAFTVMDLGLRKLRVPLVPYLMAPGYGTYTHLSGGLAWFQMGCM